MKNFGLLLVGISLTFLSTNDAFAQRRGLRIPPAVRQTVMPATPDVSTSTKVAIPDKVVELTEAQKEDIQNTLTKAKERFDAGDIAKAAQLIGLASDLDTSLEPPGTMMAKWAAMSGNPQQVRAMLDNAVIAHPDDPEAYILLADIASMDKRRTEATLLLARGQEVLEKYNKNRSRKLKIEKAMWSNLAGIYEMNMNYDSAIACLEKLEKLETANDDIAQILKRNGLIRMIRDKAGDKDESQRLFQKSFQLQPKQLPPEAIIAQNELRKGDPDLKAESMFKQAVDKYPDNSELAGYMANYYLEKGQFDDSKKFLDQLTVQNPNSAELAKVQGLIAMQTGKISDAETNFRKALSTQPNDAFLRNAFVFVLLEQSDNKAKLDEATKLAEENLIKFPSQDGAMNLAWAFHLTGKNDPAERLLTQVLSRGQLGSNAAVYAASMLIDKGNKDAAKELLKTVLETKAPFIKRADAEKLLADLE